MLRAMNLAAAKNLPFYSRIALDIRDKIVVLRMSLPFYSRIARVD